MDAIAPKLVLTGMMGSGKTVVGRGVSERLGIALRDTDQEIATLSGLSVRELFERFGEEHFRQLEREMVDYLAQRPQPMVIATGGGTMVDLANYQRLAPVSFIVCLTASVDVLAARVGRKPQVRPKLTQGPNRTLKERITELLEERREAYSRADLTVDSSELSVDQAADLIAKAFVAWRRERCRPSA